MLCESCGQSVCLCAQSIEDIDAWADQALGDIERGIAVDGTDKERLWASREANGKAALVIVHPRPDEVPQDPVALEDLEDLIQ